MRLRKKYYYSVENALTSFRVPSSDIHKFLLPSKKSHILSLFTISIPLSAFWRISEVSQDTFQLFIHIHKAPPRGPQLGWSCVLLCS